MNRIYRLVWSTVHRTWIVTGELTRSHKKNSVLCAAVVIGISSAALGSTETITGSKVITESVTGKMGANNTNGTDGEDGGIGIELSGTSPEESSVTVESGVTVSGGNGGSGYNGGSGITASDLTITNKGAISGGYGGDSGDGETSGLGGDGISGDYLTITNSGTISGSSGGDGISGDYLTITNSDNGKISGGDIGMSVGGGNGGDGIRGSYMTITNSDNGTISGGGAAYSRDGGDGISGSYMTITNSDNGTVSGGTGGTDGYNGSGGDGISGDYLTITNSGTISGGLGGYNSSGTGKIRGDGGDGISGSYLNITNSGTISGGGPEMNESLGSVGDDGYGGDGISGSYMTITNNGKISGGLGGYSFSGGDGGDGISGEYLTITNSDNGTISGGGGGYDNYVSSSFTGGDGISGEYLTITNSGEISGGYGRDDIALGSGEYGGKGGDGISGSYLTITNSDNGTISGGGPEMTEDNGYGGTGGTGGTGISGSYLTITNSGNIQGGISGDGQGLDDENDYTDYSGGNGGDGISGSYLTITNSGKISGGIGGGDSASAGAAIRLTGGTNSLKLQSGSQISGDIILGKGTADDTNSLSVISDAATTVTGNLTVDDYASVSLSGDMLTLTGSASLLEYASISFGKITGDAALHADSVSLDGSAFLQGNISYWDKSEYTLISTDNGITGFTSATVSNKFLPDGATDYAQIFVDEKNIVYGLKWSNVDNTGYGTFDLKDGATVTLGVALADNSRGISDIWDGKSLTKGGGGTLILSADNTYTGSTTVNAGTLKLGKENAIASTSGVTISDGATLNLGGNNQTVTALNNSGTVLINDISANAQANVVTLHGNVTNSGTVVINNCASCAGQTLAVAGDWTGNGGTVSIGTVLGGDGSLTDKLAISGAATGKTWVSITKEGGAGAQTLEGIEVITTGSSTENAFAQSGRIVAGSYDYFLQQGTASGANTNNWYLTSYNNSGGDTQVYRPERGSYVSNLQAAGTMFNTSLKDRQGGTMYIDPITGERHTTSMWLRAVGGHTEGRISDGESKYSANRMVFQLGGDVLTGHLTSEDEWHLGVMGGYGKQNSNTHNNLSGYNSKGSVWGYSTGLYGTWYQNAKERTGLYADSWVLYNWFDNSVKGDELAYEKYKSKGVTASLESGYKFHIGSYLTGNGMENNVYVTPQAQVLWSGVKADNHKEVNGAQVQGRGSDNLQTRLGVRLSMTGQSHQDKGTVRQFEPFVEVNWLYTDKDYGVKMGDSTAYLEGHRNVAELKAGVEGRLSKNLSVWGNVAQQLGTDSYQDTQGMLGVKYAF